MSASIHEKQMSSKPPTPAVPAFDPEMEIRDHLDVNDWRDVMFGIAERHGFDGEDIAPFTSGTDVVWATATEVFKLTTPKWASQMANETAILRGVHGALPVQTPEVIATGDLDGWPYFIMTRVPGVAVGEVWETRPFESRRDFAAQLGRLTAQLHQLHTPASVDDDWDAFWRRCRDAAVAHNRRGCVDGHATAPLFDELETFLNATGPLMPRAHGLLHTELLHHHVLVDADREDLKITSLIDFADSRQGAIEYDFAAPVEFIFKGEPGLFGAFLRGYGIEPTSLDDNAAEQALAWALCHQFSSLSRMLDALGGPHPRSLSELAQRLFGVDTA